MKKSTLLIPLFLLLAGLLTGCSGAAAANAWPGVTADVENETVYLAYNTQVYALQLASGVQKTAYPQEPVAARTFFAPPVLSADGQLLVSGYDKTVASLNPQTLAENWVFKDAKNRFIAPPVVSGEVIYAACTDEKLYALDRSGNPLWPRPFDAGQALWAAPALSPDGQTLYQASMDRRLYAIQASDGSLRWSREMGGASVGTPAVSPAGDTLYIGTMGNELLALRASDGQIEWRLAMDGWVWAGPVLHDGMLIVGDLSGALSAINPANGSRLWTMQPDGPIIGQPLVIEDSIYIGTESGSVYAVDLEGNVRWSLEIGGKIYTSPVQAGDLILVAPIEADRLLAAIDTSGALRWSFSLPQQ
jgi:outer membrane protein assembly factor BamB